MKHHRVVMLYLLSLWNKMKLLMVPSPHTVDAVISTHIMYDELNTDGENSGEVRQSFKVGKLNLVDLAGSERVRISGATGKRLEESKHINSSLAGTSPTDNTFIVYHVIN
jgi:hypothetical protein